MNNLFSNEMKTTMKQSDTKIVKILWNKLDIRVASKTISNEIQLAIRLKEDYVLCYSVEGSQRLFVSFHQETIW